MGTTKAMDKLGDAIEAIYASNLHLLYKRASTFDSCI